MAHHGLQETMTILVKKPPLVFLLLTCIALTLMAFCGLLDLLPYVAVLNLLAVVVVVFYDATYSCDTKSNKLTHTNVAAAVNNENSNLSTSKLLIYSLIFNNNSIIKDQSNPMSLYQDESCITPSKSETLETLKDNTTSVNTTNEPFSSILSPVYFTTFFSPYSP